ncbi:MAG: signal recognition particle protein [Coraliomargarita sp. TMED73]|nr:MAG: signal recognition particle protein [Coraliomargarita sp. TMED73]|tara:strand:- start:17210 stop:18571 length:1362 start_codon:yes stop_codon:yes gene_type:complete
MLEQLTEKLGHALRNLRGAGKLTEENMADALKEVRQALLSADVHFKVAKEFVQKVEASCVGQEVVKSVTPGQQVVKIINDELVRLLGEGDTELEHKKPLRLMLVGLHGSGKTTSSGKLARYLARKHDYRPALIACDVYRPAAIDQLETLAKAEGCAFHADRTSKDVVQIGRDGLKAAKEAEANLVIFDTAGRLQIDSDLIEEIQRLKKAVQPDEILLVADSALGQEAVNVAKHFHEAVQCTGLILTKLDGDARGGAALSMKHITGVPIKFMGLGEKADDFEVFHPDRMASRILGMGDVVSLVEKAQETIDQDEAARMAEKMSRASFDLNDFLKQMQQVKKMGSLGSIVGMLPGAANIEVGDKEEKKMARTEAIILSMTAKERSMPRLLRGSRLKRVANGSGVKVRDVNALLKQFGQMQKMMKMMKGGKGRRMMKAMQAEMPEGNPSLPGMPKL